MFLAGHGRSGGLKGQVISVDHYVTDVITHVEVVKEKFPKLPVFIVGHSMVLSHEQRLVLEFRRTVMFYLQGGTITLLAALERPQLFQGVVLIGPFIVESPETASPFKKFLARHLSKIVPRLGIETLNNDHLTFNREVVRNKDSTKS